MERARAAEPVVLRVKMETTGRTVVPITLAILDILCMFVDWTSVLSLQ
jgi:hypothetical protein